MGESRNPDNNTIVRPYPVDAFPSGSEASRTALQFHRNDVAGIFLAPGSDFFRESHGLKFFSKFNFALGNAECF